MKTATLYILSLLILLLGGLTACNPTEPEVTRQVLICYMPWAPTLQAYFQQNIRDIEQTISQRGLADERVLVYWEEDNTQATLYEITYTKKKCQHVTIQEYTNPTSTAEYIRQLLKDIQAYAPAEHYGMLIEGHGTAWLPAGANPKNNAPQKTSNQPITRWFGGTNQTNISTLTQSLTSTGMHLDYILFDNCFMASIETLYELKDVTDYVIASPTEIMAAGMPYATICTHLLGTPDYKTVCDDFYVFYSNYYYPYGTLSITNCHEIDTLADIVRTIVQTPADTLSPTEINNLQHYDGFAKHIFYDLQDYISAICTDTALYQQFTTQMERTVPYRVHTQWFYTEVNGEEYIHTFSGLSTSAPSTNSCTTEWPLTPWAQYIYE